MAILEFKDYITGLAADASPNAAADYVVTYDASAGTTKKVLLQNLPSGMPAADILRSYLAATETYTADNTLNDTALSVNVAASTKYAIRLIVYSTSAGQGINLDFAGTATITNFVGQWIGYLSGTFNGSAFVTAAGTDFSPNNDGADGYVVFEGSVEINGAGTFLVRAAQNASDASNTTMLRGSTLILTKMT